MCLFLFVSSPAPVIGQFPNSYMTDKLTNCYSNPNKTVVVGEGFYDVLTKHGIWTYSESKPPYTFQLIYHQRRASVRL